MRMVLIASTRAILWELKTGRVNKLYATSPTTKKVLLNEFYQYDDEKRKLYFYDKSDSRPSMIVTDAHFKDLTHRTGTENNNVWYCEVFPQKTTVTVPFKSLSDACEWILFPTNKFGMNDKGPLNVKDISQELEKHGIQYMKDNWANMYKIIDVEVEYGYHTYYTNQDGEDVTCDPGGAALTDWWGPCEVLD